MAQIPSCRYVGDFDDSVTRIGFDSEMLEAVIGFAIVPQDDLPPPRFL